MKDVIQKLISELEDRKKSLELTRHDTYIKWISADFRKSECDFFIIKLTLLLNAEAETNGEKDCKNDGNAV